MALGSAQMTITTAANFIPELWGPQVILATEARLVLVPLTWDWSRPGQTKGDTIRIPNVSNLTVNAKSANSQVTLNAPTEQMVTLTINRHDEVSFLLEDITKTQADFNLMDLYTKKSGYGIGNQRDARISTLFSGLSQIVGSAGVDIGDQQVRDAIELLDIGDVPDEERALVVHPTQKNALWGIEKYFRADIRGDGASPVVNGKFGNIYGISTYVTTNLGTSAGARLNALFHKETFGTVGQLGPRTQSDYILEFLGWLVVSDCVYGEIEARDPFGVWMKS